MLKSVCLNAPERFINQEELRCPWALPRSALSFERLSFHPSDNGGPAGGTEKTHDGNAKNLAPPTVDCSITAVLPQPVRIDGVQEFEFYSPQFPQSTGKNSMARLPVQETDICLLEGADRQYQSRNSGCIAGSSSVGSLAARPIRPFAAASDSGLAGPTNATSPDTSAFPVTLKRWSTPNPTCGASCGR